MSREGNGKVSEVAEYLAVGKSTVYALMARGDLRWVAIGRAKRISWAAVEEFVNRNQKGGWNGDGNGRGPAR